MAVTRFTEHRDSRPSTANPPTITTVWKAQGDNDEAVVAAHAYAATPNIYTSQWGTLYRQDIKVDPEGFKIFRVEVPYAKNDRTEVKLSYDTSGATVHITHSKETIQSYAAAGVAPDHKQAIGVDGDDVKGTDTTIPALKITATLNQPIGASSIARTKILASYTGQTNETPFLTFDPGEVLYLGSQGDIASTVETPETHHFAMSQNATNLTIGDITAIDKKGWQHVWISYKNAVDQDQPTKQPEFVYVERVYEEFDMAAVLGFGS